MNKAYLLIGSNMGNREEILQKAKERIEDTCGTIRLQSSIYQTAPWGLATQDDYLNQAISIETALDAFPLLKNLLAIEDGLGRKRNVMYGPRVIDIDILFFNAAIIQEADLVVPHPQMQNRRFVLVPMAEISPQLTHPLLQKTIAQLLATCPDTLAVQKFQ